jgi:hypothetical protein
MAQLLELYCSSIVVIMLFCTFLSLCNLKSENWSFHTKKKKKKNLQNTLFPILLSRLNPHHLTYAHFEEFERPKKKKMIISLALQILATFANTP